MIGAEVLLIFMRTVNLHTSSHGLVPHYDLVATTRIMMACMIRRQYQSTGDSTTTTTMSAWLGLIRARTSSNLKDKSFGTLGMNSTISIRSDYYLSISEVYTSFVKLSTAKQHNAMESLFRELGPSQNTLEFQCWVPDMTTTVAGFTYCKDGLYKDAEGPLDPETTMKMHSLELHHSGILVDTIRSMHHFSSRPNEEEDG